MRDGAKSAREDEDTDRLHRKMDSAQTVPNKAAVLVLIRTYNCSECDSYWRSS